MNWDGIHQSWFRAGQTRVSGNWFSLVFPVLQLPQLSVLIATFNRLEVLQRTLDDLESQSFKPYEVIVVDQSCDENDRPVDHAKQLSGRPLIRYIHQKEPNAQVARNTAIAEARSPILVMIDDDMHLPAGFLRCHAENYAQTPDLHAVAGQVLKPGRTATDHIPSIAMQKPDGWMFFPLNYAHRCPVINWPSCNGSIRKEVAIAAGGFDEQFTRTWYDDSDFSWRLHQIGARVVLDPRASAVHLKVNVGGKRSSGKNSYVLADAHYWATLLYFWRKNFGLWPARRNFILYLRRVFARKVLLFHPSQMVIAWKEFLKGYQLASRRLCEGPRYRWPMKSLEALDKTL